MLENFRANREGFLTRDSSDSRAKGANLPGIAAFFAAIDEVISSGSAPVTADKACLHVP